MIWSEPGSGPTLRPMNESRIPPSEVISVEIADHVATVWLDRPEKLNAFGAAAWRDLPLIMEALGSDHDARVVVIAARGRAFSAGIDLYEMGPLLAPQDADGVAERRELHRNVRAMQHTFSSIADCPKPVIAAVHGQCLGAGMDLVTACDLRLASSDAIFSVRETRMAMVADVGTLQRLPGIVGPGYAAEMIYTGADFSAADAARMGLVNEVLADHEALHDAAEQLARRVAGNSPLAVQGAKAILRANEGRTVHQALDHVALWSAAFLRSDDLGEALEAFHQKRPPEFRGE